MRAKTNKVAAKKRDAQRRKERAPRWQSDRVGRSAAAKEREDAAHGSVGAAEAEEAEEVVELEEERRRRRRRAPRVEHAVGGQLSMLKSEPRSCSVNGAWSSTYAA